MKCTGSMSRELVRKVSASRADPSSKIPASSAVTGIPSSEDELAIIVALYADDRLSAGRAWWLPVSPVGNSRSAAEWRGLTGLSHGADRRKPWADHWWHVAHHGGHEQR